MVRHCRSAGTPSCSSDGLPPGRAREAAPRRRRREGAAVSSTTTTARPVRIAGLSKQFGALTAVADVSLDVAPGEFLTLLGPSGSGKTTLLMMIAGFTRPSAGSIRIGGQDVT